MHLSLYSTSFLSPVFHTLWWEAMHPGPILAGPPCFLWTLFHPTPQLVALGSFEHSQPSSYPNRNKGSYIVFSTNYTVSLILLRTLKDWWVNPVWDEKSEAWRSYPKHSASERWGRTEPGRALRAQGCPSELVCEQAPPRGFQALASHLRSAVLCLVARSRPTLCDAMDCSPPGSSVHGDSPGKKLEWVAMPCSRNFPNPGLEARSPALQADSLLSDRWILCHLTHQGSPGILEWVAYPFSQDLSNPGIEPASPALQVDSLPAELPGKPICSLLIGQISPFFL